MVFYSAAIAWCLTACGNRGEREVPPPPVVAVPYPAEVAAETKRLIAETKRLVEESKRLVEESKDPAKKQTHQEFMEEKYRINEPVVEIDQREENGCVILSITKITFYPESRIQPASATPV
jgi:predicted small lipoprotein YifL